MFIMEYRAILTNTSKSRNVTFYHVLSEGIGYNAFSDYTTYVIKILGDQTVNPLEELKEKLDFKVEKIEIWAQVQNERTGEYEDVKIREVTEYGYLKEIYVSADPNNMDYDENDHVVIPVTTNLVFVEKPQSTTPD